MNILREMQMDMGLLPRYERRRKEEEQKAKQITAWLFREGRAPELTVVENTAAGFSKVIKTEDLEDITLTCGLAVICDADNWWSDGECTFAVGDVSIRGTVLVVGADDDGFVTIPRQALTLGGLQEMCFTA